jgi:hypothetical protein
MRSGEIKTKTRGTDVQRLTYISARPFAEVLARLESKVGRPGLDLDDKVEALLAEASNPGL